MYDCIPIGDIKHEFFLTLPDASIQCSLNKKSCQMCIAYGEKISVEMDDIQMAGSAPNVAIGLARQGRKAAVLSIMGDDAVALFSKSELEKEGVSSRYVKTRKDIKSSVATVINFKGERSILAGHADVSYRIPKTFPKTRWVHVSELGSGYEKLYKDLAAQKARRGYKISFNPGVTQIKERKPELMNLIKKTDVLFVNVEEAQKLLKSRSRNIQTLVSGLHKLGVKTAFLTDGRQGAYASEIGDIFHLPILPGERVEATGAGDSFASGCLGAIMAGKSIPHAMVWGSINATSVIKYIGGQIGLLSRKEIEAERYRLSDYHATKLN